jgi:ABC-2 type transport system permease protein
MTATWREIARKDFEDAVRSKVLWGISAVFVAFLVMSLLSADQLFPREPTVDATLVLAGVGMLAQLFVPGIALVVGYMAVTGEHRSGSLRVLLTYPFDRGDVVLGKLVGRVAVTVTALATGLAVATVLVVALYGYPGHGKFLGFVGASVLLALTFTGLAVGGSAATATRSRSMAVAFGSFVAMVFFWKPVSVALHYAAYGTRPGIEVEPWYLLVRRLNPLEAYRVVLGSVLGERVQPVPNLPVADVSAATPSEQLLVGNRVAGEVPWYLQDWTAVAVLLAWGLVPLTIGYVRFRRSDLG